MSSHYPEPDTFFYILKNKNLWDFFKQPRPITKVLEINPGAGAALMVRGFQLTTSPKFGRLQTYSCYNCIEREIQGNSVSFTLSQGNILPQISYGGVPRTTTGRTLNARDGWDGELDFQTDSAATQDLLNEHGDWKIFITIIPASIETTNVGNFELNFLNQAVVYKDILTNYVKDFVNKGGVSIPQKQQIFICGAVDFAQQADFSRKFKNGYRPDKEAHLIANNRAWVNTANKENQIVKIQANKSFIGLNTYCGQYEGDNRRAPLQPSNVSFMFLSQIGHAGIAHEFIHAFPILIDTNVPSPQGRAMKGFNKLAGPLGYYKTWAGNPNLTEIPIEDKGHNLPANSIALKVVNPFFMVGGIPHPVPFGISSYGIGGLKYTFLEYAYLKEQDASFVSKPIENFAPQDKSVFKTSLCNNLTWEYSNLAYGREPPNRFVTDNVKSEFQKMEQTKCYFLLFLSCYGFFPTVPRPSSRTIILRTGDLFNKFEEIYKDEYDLPYSDTNLNAINNGSVILFKTDSLNPTVLNTPFTSRADSGIRGAVNYYSNHSSAVLDYVGFRYVEKIVTVMNGEILKKVSQSQNTRIPGTLSTSTIREENLIVSKKTADEYDADSAIPGGIDDIIESYFGGRKCRQELEIKKPDGSISCEEYYVIVANAPSSSGFTSYTLTDPYENIQADVLIP